MMNEGWAQAISIIGANLIALIWVRTEANQDRRDTQNLIREIQSEMRDFHDKLVQIEARRK